MTDLGHERWPGLSRGGQWLKAFLLQAAGVRPLICEYCASAIPVGEVQCRGCGAIAGHQPSPVGRGTVADRQWIMPLLLCLFFPPALLVVGPVLFWRWLRKADRGWLPPLLVCLFFPPAVLLVAPALLWRPPNKREGP